MDLYILRHGIAEDVSDTGTDRDRALTDEGLEKTGLTGKALKKLGIEFDLVLSSPFTRAWQTAMIIVDNLECRKLLHTSEALSSGAPSAGVLTDLKKHSRKASSILLVGHEPDLSRLISLLLSGSPDLCVTMKKGGLCKLICAAPEPGGARLEWLLTPKHLSRMA